MVELVIVIPLFLMLVMGMVTGGTVYNHKLDLVHAAREGARYGAAIPQAQCNDTSKCGGKTWAGLVQSVVVQRSDGDVTTPQVCVALVSGSGGTVVGGSGGQTPFTTKDDHVSNCYDDGGGDTFTRVQVQIKRTGDSINAVFFTVPVTLTSTATARFEQQ